MFRAERGFGLRVPGTPCTRFSTLNFELSAALKAPWPVSQTRYATRAGDPAQPGPAGGCEQTAGAGRETVLAPSERPDRSRPDPFRAGKRKPAGFADCQDDHCHPPCWPAPADPAPTIM